MDDEWLKLGHWPAPVIPMPTQSDTPHDAQFRQQTHDAVDRCLQSDLAVNTIKTYEALIKTEVAEVSAKLQIDFLAMITEGQFTTVFGALLVSHQEGLRWSRVRSLKAALTQWHRRRQQTCVFDNWTSSMTAFWNGLAKQCSHDTQGKEPIQMEAITQYLELDATSENVATTRNAAMVAVAFFGLRRAAEVLALAMDDIIGNDCKCLSLRVKCQKNDQLGLGQICFIPHIQGMNQA